MADYYITGTKTCKSLYNAESYIAHYGRAAVVREVDGFFIVTGLTNRPVQPGQFPFKIREGEKVYNA